VLRPQHRVFYLNRPVPPCRSEWHARQRGARHAKRSRVGGDDQRNRGPAKTAGEDSYPSTARARDESLQRRVEVESEAIAARREGVAVATGQLVGAALALAGQLLQQTNGTEPSAAIIDQMTERLASLTETDAEGRPQITIRLPDQESLRGIAATLARLLS
jgi:hypothetical protein